MKTVKAQNCLRCNLIVCSEDFQHSHSLLEFEMSGLCETCQQIVFHENNPIYCSECSAELNTEDHFEGCSRNDTTATD